MPTTAAALNASQVFILRALAKSSGLTREALEAEVGANVSCSSDNLGPAYKETLEGNGKYAGSLWGMGLVKPMYDEVGGQMVCLWHATAAGRKLASTLKTRERSPAADKVDPAVLDPIVRKFRTTRTYGLELYTDDDMRAIKSMCGAEAEGVTMEALRLQITNRRKQGAFADPQAKIRKCVEKAIREFGPDGTIASILDEDQVAAMQALFVDVDGEIESKEEGDE